MLSPRKQIGQRLRDLLRAGAIPTESFYTDEPFNPDEAKEAFALLTLVAKPDDRVCYRYLLGLGSGSFNAGEYRRLVEYCETHGTNPRESLASVVAGDLEMTGVKRLQERHAALEARVAELCCFTGESLFDELFPSTQEWSAAIRAAWASADVEVETAADVLEGLVGQIATPEVPTGDFVRIMSLHKSKGLTSRIVLVMSCLEGIMPVVERDCPQAEQERQLKEQRRLFYVALTRTTDTLVLSSFSAIERAFSYRLGVQVQGGRSTTACCVASRFLTELGPRAPAAVRGSEWSAGGY